MYAELELALHKTHAETYTLSQRYTRPDSDVDIAPVQSVAVFDFAALQAAELNADDYAQILSNALWQDADAAQFYAQVKTSVESAELLLRVRLFVSTDAPELHALRWELLREPHGEAWCFSEKILFSRYIAGADWRPIRLKPKAQLRALVVAAGGKNIDEYGLAEVDVVGELQRARNGLGNIAVDILGDATPTSLDNLILQIREHKPDVLYLAAHGALHKRTGEALLYLQDDEGNVNVVKGAEFAQRLRELNELPRLIVLASCESAGTGASQGDPSTALAPLLNQAGVPAVIAMQGKISMDTVEKLMPTFFSELSQDGQLDRALAAARRSVRNEDDAWMPALFLRLKGGRLWYEAGFGMGEADFGKWQSLVHSLARGECTPIIGSGVADKLYGGNAWLARRLADENQFPLAAYQLDDLPTVSQYLSLAQSPTYAREQVQEQMRQELLRGQDIEQQNLSLPKLLKYVSERANADEAHHILAELNCPLYITANPDNLLSLALSAANKPPTTVFCPWKRNPDDLDALFSIQPTVDNPLVYHILGHFKDKDSLVLTEDDYFQYLIGVTLNKKLVPPVVREATVNSALLFLGFQLTDWSFRVLFRLIMSQGGRRRLDEYTHVAVQVEPEEHSSINPDQAKAYLEKYFEGHGNFSIYWGTATDFLKELRERMKNIEVPVVVTTEEDDDEWE